MTASTQALGSWRLDVETTIRRLEIDLSASDFAAAKRLADQAAASLLADPICLAWVDAVSGRESPAHASECHGSCEIPGAVEYARYRGAELEVVVGGGRYIFCYRSPGEFAGV
jgi:hypothetical protein